MTAEAKAGAGAGGGSQNKAKAKAEDKGEGVGEGGGEPPARPFRFLSVFAWDPRKGWPTLLKAFAKEFPAGDDAGDADGADATSGAVQLVIKTKARDGRPLSALRKEAAKALGRKRLPANILLYSGGGGGAGGGGSGAGKGKGRGRGKGKGNEGELSEEEYAALYHASDAFVLPTHAEGWCRPCMEAMAVGKPTIVTGWSAMTEFMADGKTALLVNYTMGAVPDAAVTQHTRKFQHKQWAMPDQAHLRQLMRAVVEDGPLRASLGAAAHASIARGFSRRAVGERMRERLALVARRMRGTRRCGGGGAVRPRAAAAGEEEEAAEAEAEAEGAGALARALGISRGDQAAAAARVEGHTLAKALHGEGIDLQRKKQYGGAGGAAAALRAALAATESPELRAHINLDLCTVLYTQGDYPAGIRACRAVVEAQPLAIRARGILAVMYALSKRRGEAEAVAREASALDPSFALAQQVLSGKI
jgi:hypothetical protein